MTRLLTLISICISALACSGKVEEIPTSQIMGDWYYIDKEVDENIPYHEVHIDSSEIHFHLGNGFTPTFEYALREDTLHFTSLGDSWPVWVLKEIKADTLIVEYLERQDNSKRILKVIRLDEGETVATDFDPKNWKDVDSFQEYKHLAYNRRYDEYLVKSGQVTWEEITEWRNKNNKRAPTTE